MKKLSFFNFTIIFYFVLLIQNNITQAAVPRRTTQAVQSIRSAAARRAFQTAAPNALSPKAAQSVMRNPQYQNQIRRQMASNAWRQQFVPAAAAYSLAVARQRPIQSQSIPSDLWSAQSSSQAALSQRYNINNINVINNIKTDLIELVHFIELSLQNRLAYQEIINELPDNPRVILAKEDPWAKNKWCDVLDKVVGPLRNQLRTNMQNTKNQIKEIQAQIAEFYLGLLPEDPTILLEKAQRSLKNDFNKNIKLGAIEYSIDLLCHFKGH